MPDSEEAAVLPWAYEKDLESRGISEIGDHPETEAVEAQTTLASLAPGQTVKVKAAWGTRTLIVAETVETWDSTGYRRVPTLSGL